MISTNNKRQIVLDTETTGMNKQGIYYEGHRIIEIGAVEIINRHLTGRQFHTYLNPNRLVDLEAFNVHGISDEFLVDKPTFNDMTSEFLNFIDGSELIIHNAPFDIGFINYELKMSECNINKIDTLCQIIDSLQLARKMFPGKRNSLDALCNRYLIDNSKRKLHGALVDAEILADIFLLMTMGQTSICFTSDNERKQYSLSNNALIQQCIQRPKTPLLVIRADSEEIIAHEQRLDLIQKKNGICLWRILEK